MERKDYYFFDDDVSFVVVVVSSSSSQLSAFVTFVVVLYLSPRSPEVDETMAGAPSFSLFPPLLPPHPYHRRRQIFPIHAHSIHDAELFSTFGKQICIPIQPSPLHRTFPSHISTNDIVNAFLVSSAFVALINISLVIPLRMMRLMNHNPSVWAQKRRPFLR